MNENDIETIKKLKEMRNNNVLTQEEFDWKVAAIVNCGDNTNSTIEQKDDKPSRQPIYSNILRPSFLIFILYAIYYIYSLFHTPSCNAGEVEALLRQILQRDILPGFSISLDSFSETSYDKQNDTRKCQASVTVNGHSENIKYTVKDTDFRHFNVSLDDDSYDYLYYKYKLLCDNQEEVVPLLFNHIEDNLNVKPVSLENHKELLYDEKTYKRQCTATLKFNDDKKETIRYSIEKSDADNFSVSLDDDSYDYLYYKYELLCDNQEEVVSLLFEHIEDNLNVKPVSLENHKELSYDEKTYKRQCTATLKFNDDKKETIRYSIEKSDADNFSVSLDDDSYDIIDRSEKSKYQDEGSIFACDETSMDEAQDLINKSFPNWNNSLKLTNPTTVQQSENHLKCKVSYSFRDFPTMYYELDKQSDGKILITTNPILDKIEEELGTSNSDSDLLDQNPEDIF